jgi:hypothetical protein
MRVLPDACGRYQQAAASHCKSLPLPVLMMVLGPVIFMSVPFVQFLALDMSNSL